ncbi:Ig-like domain-containing protein [Candidatus Uhrbacteria bacterium]|nr:Ig-like domain-containing protein [Candidatus Uhrbacteria bacterium]
MRTATRLTFLCFLLALILSGVFVAVPVSAQEVDFESFAEAAGFSTSASVTVIIARLIRTAISFVGVVAVVFLLYGGFVWMTAGGNADRLKKAKQIIINAIIGLLLVFASFAIVSFVLGALVDATGADISGSDAGPGSYADGSGSSVFYLSSVNTECAEALQNLQLQFVFSKRVDSGTVEEGIVIEDAGGTLVDGTFSTSNRTVTFTPSQACESPYGDEFCFDALSSYTIEVDSSVVESTSGSSLTCTTTYPCTFSFTTGEEVDIEDPSVVMDAPEDGESLYAGSIELLQALTSDDSGVSTVDFYVIDDEEAIYSSGVDFSAAGALTGSNVVNAFFTDTLEEWDTEGYTTNEEYDVWARGYDCAGNTDTASQVTIVLRAANCNNEVLDEDLGETEVDCGGEPSSAYYCGACEGDECTEDADCASGQCVDGLCVTTPKIEGVSPGDGAVGNLVTISGEGFGADEGVITFLGTESGDEVQTTAYACNAQVQWSETEIIVQVPDDAMNGPISVTTSEEETERTDDTYGPSILPFDVNAIERPGICELDPNTDDYGSSIDVYGNSFGSEQGSSTFYFTNYEASSYLSWEDEQLDVVVPNVNAGVYLGQVWTGDYLCIDKEGNATTTICADDTDCDADAQETCATRWCSETLDYCATDDDCDEGEGTCESIRVGSNTVAFTVADIFSSTNPIISSVDSGWKACSDDNAHCGDDDDCNEGATCDDASTWGPPGQYVTIYGTGFGTSTGSIMFENESLGYTALGDTDFPDACGDDFWHDTYVTVKVPETYQTASLDPIDAIEHALTLERADGVDSDAVEFVVLDDTPGPAICDIDPSAGPAELEVTIAGENFGTADGTVTFYSLQEADYSLWENDEISSVIVPEEAQTGPVYVEEAVNGYSSNSITFTVGDCREDASLCSEGESCCSNGACSESCEDVTDVEAHYAFKITTGITPNTPQVIVSCSTSGVSPSPWEGWSQPEDVCVTASVEAEFNMAMNPLSINSSTVLVEKCTALTEGECTTWVAVPGVPVPDETGFAWSPTAGALATNSLHRVTLQGEDQIVSAAGGYLEEDFSWEFTTSSSGAPCEVGDVNVRPSVYTETEQTDVDYSAQLIAANDLCVAVSCTGYTLSWASDFDGAVIDPAVPGTGICINDVAAQEETPANDPAGITATVTNAQNDPTDTGLLTINFVDPEIDDYFPQCSTACVNALPWGEFNTVMSDTTIDEGSVTLYTCLNSLCETSGLVEADMVDSVSYSSTTKKFYINFEDGETMDANTWYRVVVDGDAVLSYTGVALSESGSNYGTDENRYFENDFSWRFKTKDDDVSCALDSVTLDPALATMSYVGERAEFDATGQGEPDDCSAQGQTLQSGSFDWAAWTATDDPNTVGATTGSASSQNEITAYMISAGAIELTSDIPNYCTAACLNAGAPVTEAQGVCGNGTVETSEECDDGATADDDGCSSVCLNEGNDQCPFRCSDSSAACTTDASCEESCESAVCSSALDVDEGCTLDGDCESGSCSESGTCEDYEDAEATCSNNGTCDSGSCVGSCSISLAVCSGSDIDCPYDTGGTCELSGSGCCGDGVRQAVSGEDCDDGNLTGGDGCSAICLNEGSRSVNAVCGEGVRDWAANTGGEDCDDENSASGDGCSANCLLEGSTAEEDVYAICGNNIVENGEDCDPGDYDLAGDGCSSLCLKEGTVACPPGTPTSSLVASVVNCCGNGIVGVGEECDGTEGCSNRCLRAGSSYAYSTPSFCGDGETGTGEECDALSSAAFSVGDYGVSQIATGSPEEVNEFTGYAISTVSVTVGGTATGEATVQLQCACTTDASCGVIGIGCGESNCCFERPTIVAGQIAPADNIASNITTIAATTDYNGSLFTGNGYCRNTAVWLTFSEAMNEATFDPTQDTDGDGVIDQSEFTANLYLDLVSKDTNGDGVLEAVDEVVDCPTGYEGANPPPASSSSASRLWNWLKRFVLGLFGQETSASSTFACHVPVTYEVAVQANGTSRVYLRADRLFEEDAVYRLVVVGDADAADTQKQGVLSADDVTLCVGEDCNNTTFTREFAVGDDICDLDRVLLEDTGKVPPVAEYESPSIGFFSTTGENHAFVATPQTYRVGGYEEIAPLPGLYAWGWGWSSSVVDTLATDVVASVSETPQDTTRNYTASGSDGREIVLSTATITSDVLFSPTTAAVVDDLATPLINEARAARTVGGTREVQALLCENPWPSLTSTTMDFPYLEDDLPSNFSFYYCRDAGDPGTEDDLPALEDPIDVTSLASSGIIQELIFKVSGTSDAIGVRVVPNDEAYLTPQAWVEEQEFSGSFSATELDGYPAVQAGNTIYVAAANVNAGAIYPNMYIVSYNDNASSEAQDIFDQLLTNWRFNGNTNDVTDINLCQDSATGSYWQYYESEEDEEGEYVSCEWDGDCFDKFKDTGIVCDAQKGKLTRDMVRLLDVMDMAATVNTFGEENGHCSVTKGQSCTQDTECPGTEECVAGFPTVQSGTFVPALSNSIWSSWNASLANELGVALPTDPINEFYNCAETVDDVETGYDAASCWNGEEGTFICPENSHLYGYRSVGGEDYLLYAQLESSGNNIWEGDLDTSSVDEVTIVVEYPTGNAPSNGMPLGSGFSSTPVFCDASAWGESSLCGDGTQGAGEDCEIGDTDIIACTDSDGDDGVITVACLPDCSDFQDETQAETAGAECAPYDCGNGVVETGEDCDDGALNGTYGHCADTCQDGDGFFCGDGYLAASEVCDCGTTSNFSSLPADSWADLNSCDVSNGQYDASADNCAYNCTLPGLSCGDGRVNGSEECDGDYEESLEALCSDGLTTCTSDSDCNSGDTCGDLGYETPGVGSVCVGGEDEGDACDNDGDCTDSTCSINTYDLYRYRVCEADCTWPSTWIGPVGGDQQCGNGIVEGNESCDDGNSSNNDACLNTCVGNVCGDDYVYVGVESCDDGSLNGTGCVADYESTCNSCTATCQYQTSSGGYCGDGEVDEGEICDGGYSTALRYFDATTSTTSGACETYGGSTTVDDIDYTCRWLGVCNGGAENGEYCTLNYNVFLSSGNPVVLSSGTDANSCAGGTCEAPVCADDCGSACPFGYETTGLLVQSQVSAEPMESINLYSYLNAEGDSPDNGTLTVPACAVATTITADLDDANITPPDVDIVFVTDLTGSMNDTLGGDRQIDLAVDSTIDAIEELFDAYDGSGATMQIGLVSYTTSYSNADFCNENNAQSDGARTDSLLVGEDEESSLISYVESYSTCVTSTSGSTPTYNGIEEAVALFATSTADVKIVIVLSDGDFDWIDSADSASGWTVSESCDPDDPDDPSDPFYSKTYNTNVYKGKAACAADMYDDFMDEYPLEGVDPDILFYTAAITSSSVYKGYTAHISSNECAWASASSASSVSDCTGNYAFSAENQEEIQEMYESIVDSILGTNVTFTATDATGDTTSTTGEVQAGSDVVLPFPDGFVCQSTEQQIPVRNVFYGTGSMLFSDFTFTYCPYQ